MKHSLIALALAACGSSDVEFVMQATIPAGSETTLCKFVKMPVGTSWITSGRHVYTPGSHHMLLFRTDVTALAAGMDQIQDCYEGGGGTIMSHVRGVLYGSQEAQGSMTLPDGIGFKAASEEVLLLQVHYLNASPTALDSRVTVDLHAISDVSKIQSLAGVLFYYDPFIYVPAGATATANASCALAQDLTLLDVFPHYHARGVAYRAYLDAPTAPSSEPFYTSTDWSHPAKWSGGPMAIAAGSSIRWYCDYDNSGGSSDYFQGLSALSNEMCMFTGAYYPAMDATAEECRLGMGMFGSGAQTCGATLGCLQTCPPGSAPKALGGSGAADGMPNVSECWQKCVAESCPAASAPLLRQLYCLGTKCATDCAAGGQQCATCAGASCAAESSACLNATCN